MLGIESKPFICQVKTLLSSVDSVVSVPSEGHLKGVFCLAGKEEVCAKIFQECVPKTPHSLHKRFIFGNVEIYF